MEDYESKLTAYAEKLIELTQEIEIMEKNPDAYNEADIGDKKVEIKQLEALIKDLQLSIKRSTTVFESLRVQVGHHIKQMFNIMPSHRQKHVFLFRSQPWR